MLRSTTLRPFLFFRIDALDLNEPTCHRTLKSASFFIQHFFLSFLEITLIKFQRSHLLKSASHNFSKILLN